MSPPTAPLTDKANRQNETRDKLIEAALREFAEHGVQAVTLASIRQAARQANRSVVHYHFKDRDALVEAVVQRVFVGLRAFMVESETRYKTENLSTGGNLPRLVELMFDPFWRYYMQHPEGRVGIQFLSRMTWQTGSLGRNLLREFFAPYGEQFAPALSKALPELERSDIQLRLYLGVNTAIHGLADTAIIMQDPKIAPLLQRNDALDRAYGLLLGYLAGGIAAPLATHHRT